MDSQENANSMSEPTSGHGETTVKPNAPLPPQGFQARPQGPPPSPRNSINNGPVGAPRPGQPLLRRLDSRSSLGPSGPGQFVQLRPYGPPRPPGGVFPPRPPQPGQLSPQNPLHSSNQRFAHSPGIRGPPPPPQVGGQRPAYIGNVYQANQAQQQPRGINDPRFQRPPPDIAPQNGPPRIAEVPPQRPGQEFPPPRPFLRNDSSLSLQRQHLLSNEEIKQPRRPRIVIERMDDINESNAGVNKPEGYLRAKRSDVRQNSENDDDDDVVMDSEKSPRHDANDVSDGLTNGSKSPLTPRRHDDASRPASQSDMATTEHKLDKPDVPSRPLSANTDDKAWKDDSTPVLSQSGSLSVISNAKEEKTEDVDVKLPSADDLKSDRTSRPPSTTSISESSEEIRKPNSPYGNDTSGIVEHSLKTPARSSDNSRASTPSRLDVPQDAEQESKTPDKSRSSTPSHLETPRNAELRTPSKSPDKSRSGTPAALESYGNVEQEAKTPIKTPDKSRSSTPAGLEPPRDAERETRSPSKTPDKSRASTPAELVPSPNAEKEPDITITSDQSRPVTLAGIESSNGEAERPSENLQRDKSGESTPQMKESSRPASSLGSPNSMIERVNKSPKSPRSPMTPESQNKLSVPGSMITPPKSPDEGVKGFDNGRQRSLSPRMSPAGSPRPSGSPKSSAGSAKQADGEKKRTSFVEDPATMKKATEITNKTPTPTATFPSKPTTTPTAETRRAEKPTKLIDEKAERKSSERKAVQNGSANDTQANAVPTTNGVAESPTKRSPTKSKESDKRSTAGSPTKSPSKSAKSLPRTPETPPSTAQDKKKLPMNKVQVGAAPSPNLKTVRSKIGSLDNASYKPGGGKVKIENRKLDFSKAQPKIAAKNDKYTPSGGDKKISQVKLQWNAKSKVGSLDNATYKPGGGDKKIETVKLDFKDKAKPKVGSKDNAKHVPGGGAVKSATPPKTPLEAKNNIPTQKIEIKAESKIGSLDNVKHKPGGGDKKIFNDRDYLRQTSSNVESLNGSGSQTQTPVDDDHRLPRDVKISDAEVAQPQPPPSTPTRTRHVTSPSAVVTPRAVRSGLARSPETTTPRKQLTQEIEEQSSEDRPASKTPSLDATDGKNMPKSRSPRSPISPRPPSSLRIKSASDRSSPGTPRKTSPNTPRKTSPNTPRKTSPNTPRKTSPKELRLPKLASSPIPHEASPTTESHSKISLPKLIEPSSQSARMAY